MMLKELFDGEKIACPEYLCEKIIDDYWLNGKYSFENNVHKWSHKDSMRDVLITFDGDTYTFGAYYDGLFYVLEVTNESYSINI